MVRGPTTRRDLVVELSLSALLVLVGAVGCQRTPTIEKDGGLRLVYAIDLEEMDEVDTGEVAHSASDASEMPSALQKRLSRFRGVTVKAVGDTKFEVVVPGATQDQLPLVKQLASVNGTMRFQIMANERDHRQSIEHARTSADEVVVIDGQKVARWFDVGMDLGTYSRPQYYGIAIGDILRGRRDGDLYEPIEFDDYTREKVLTDELRLTTAIANLGFRDVQVLTVLEPPGLNINDTHVQQFAKSLDDNGFAVIDFIMKPSGAKLLDRLTYENRPDERNQFYRRLCIIFDDEVFAAPRLLGVISERGQITGDFTHDEADVVVDVLNMGRLPVILQREPISETWTEPPSRD